MPKRSFQEAAIVATGAQRFEQRFGKRQRGDDSNAAPPIAQWRCNLTGLSQTCNLFFVAYSDNIYVYVPHFATQALPEQPALIVASRQAVPGSQGYLDPRNPHAINYLVVQLLGTEEVIATVRDDGDVDAFLVRHVVQAIDRRAERDTSLRLEADEVRPFFQSNVGMSAWGLAIHSNARIIATSANTHNITIFKFGLVNHEDANNRPAEGHGLSKDRDMDVTHQVLNGTSNIPFIAFCNTGDDPDGRWLLTTDISGFCRSIDLHSMQTAQTFRFGRTASYLGGNSHDRFNSGWAIMFLDRRSFIPENDVQAALGLGEDERLPDTKQSPALWDIGATISHISDTSSKFSMPKKRSRSGRNIRSPRSSSSVQSPGSDIDLSIMTDASSSVDQELLTEADQTGDDEMLVDDAEADDSDSDSDSGESTYYLDLVPDDEGAEDSVSFEALNGGKRIHGKEPRAFQPHNNLCGNIPCPILHCSVRSVYLLQPSDQREQTQSPATAPTVGFTNALYQLVQQQHSWLNVFERLNMSAYVPAMGIVVLASQKGRALVVSLTRLSKAVALPAAMQQTGSGTNRTKYAMRIERILPFAQQEENLERPFAPLLGIATGPMQGTEHLPDEKKRWRLMMTYADHTILSYEISRRSCGDASVDLGAVVV